MEIALFKEVININPFDEEGGEATKKWIEVGENTAIALGLSKAITPRTTKTKIFKQLDYYRQNDRANLKKLVEDREICSWQLSLYVF